MTFSLLTAVRSYSRRTWTRSLPAATRLGLIAVKAFASMGYALGRRLPAPQLGPANSAVRCVERGEGGGGGGGG